MNYDELEEARQRFESVRLDFVATELEIAVTFGKLALGAASAELFRRYVRKACLAYNSAVRFLVGAQLNTEMEERIGLSMSRLEWVFRKMGEREKQFSQNSSMDHPFAERALVWAEEEFHSNGDKRGAGKLPDMPRIAAECPCKPLSPREEQIVKRVANGKCNKEIAEELGLSTRTVETYRLRMMRKLELNCVSEVVKFAIRNNLAG
jgi:DNA-binding CsgD family transcriptional regulator